MNDDIATLRRDLCLLAAHWRVMARDEDDPAVAMARKLCAVDLLHVLGVSESALRAHMVTRREEGKHDERGRNGV